MDQKELFYRRFQTSVASIQEQIDQLPSFATAGGERQDAVEACQAAISRLSSEVADASDYIPAYDQRAYAQAVKTVSDHLSATTAQFAPKSRFQFKPRQPKPAPAQDPRQGPRYPSTSEQPAHLSSIAQGQDDSIGALPKVSSTKDYNKELSKPAPAGVRKPSFSAAREIAIADQSGLHIILPSSASRATAAGSLTNLKGCIVDMSVPTASGTGAPFASLTLKNISRCLIVAGRVAGPVHLTGLTNSVVVVSARQVRVHECINVALYLHCTSHPIIEDCRGMRFAPLPASYSANEDVPEQNQWDQVDDFKWLKEEHSPNWDTVPEENRVADDVWAKVLPGGPSLSTEDILAMVDIPK